MKQPSYNAHLLKYKTGFKAVVKGGDWTHTAQWYKTEAEARTDTERFAFKYWNGEKINWLPTIDKNRKSNKETSLT